MKQSSPWVRPPPTRMVVPAAGAAPTPPGPQPTARQHSVHSEKRSAGGVETSQPSLLPQLYLMDGAQETQKKKRKSLSGQHVGRQDVMRAPALPARTSKDSEVAVCGGALGKAVTSTQAPQSPFTLPVGQKPVFQDERQTRVGVVQFEPRVRGRKAAGADISAEKGPATSPTGTEGWGAGPAP